ncbi:hypothetical protein GCK72_025151 [Caenorhabditis remanei]|uniref:Uncharacterized protein n=1 Tax=Caenorhabditis remanei TaxID=31234 RepID=A0A6A5G237_CAERE|nr:hypothetical protein GCK72_025151 [Caenorhabditis remanei]KAF1748684.1 hypothetical protein GCK72_025151 [Caenorhabditis remanei]
MQDSAPRTVKAAQRKTLNDDWLKRVLRNRLSQLSAQELCSVDRPSSSSVSPASSASSSSGEASPVLEDTSNAVESSVASKPSENVVSGKPRSSKGALEPEEPSNDGQGIGGMLRESESFHLTGDTHSSSMTSKESEDVDVEKPGSSQSTLEPEEPSNDGQATKESTVCHVQTPSPESNIADERENQNQVIEPAPPAINLETVRDATVSSETNDASGEESGFVQAAEEMGQSTSSLEAAPEDAPPTPTAESAEAVNNEVVEVIEKPVEVFEYHDGPRTRSRSQMEAARLARNPVPPAPQGNNKEAPQGQNLPEPVQEPVRYQIVLGDVTRYFAESGRRILEAGWKSFDLPSQLLNQEEQVEERLEEIQEEDEGEAPGQERGAEEHQELEPEVFSHFV